MLIIIPSAGIGSRLGLNTKYINKSMIQLGDLPVISRIIESYPRSAKFIIITGYKAAHIEEYVKLIYPKKKIKILRIKLFNGSGSSLTYTLSRVLHLIKEPFFFHANDTIFLDKKFYEKINSDTLFLDKKKSNTLRYASVEFGKNFKKIHNKLKYLKEDYFNYTGVSFIKDYKKFKKIIKRIKINGEGELSYFKSLNQNRINYKFINDWYDIGSIESKEKAEKIFSNCKSILPKNNQGIFFKNKIVYKFFADKNIIKNRYERSLLLKPYVPKIIKKTKFFYLYKFVNGSIFSNLKNKKKEFSKLLNWLNLIFWKKKYLNNCQVEDFEQKCFNFYYKKSLSRIDDFYRKNNIKDQIEFINNSKTKKISKMFKEINWNSIKAGIPVNFHGDLHFENIIKNKKKIILLDWREDFSGIKIYGDIYYELAKIYHGLIIDHKVIKNHNYSVIKNKKFINIKFLQSKDNKDCQNIFFNFLRKNKFSISKVKIITALIFLNIATLHHYPYSIFLYYLGKNLLSASLNKNLDLNK